MSISKAVLPALFAADAVHGLVLLSHQRLRIYHVLVRDKHARAGKQLLINLKRNEINIQLEILSACSNYSK